MKYSAKQIERVFHLITHHNYDAARVADAMGCRIADAVGMITEASGILNRALPVRKRKPLHEVKEKVQRPEAIYSNTKFY